MKHFLAIAFALLIGHQAFATHLIGGNLGYEFVGVFNGNYRYNIILTTYTNCDPNTSNFTSPEDPIEDVGIYEHDIQNDPQAGGNKNFLTTVPMTLISSETIEPDQPGACSVGQNTCISKGVYQGTVDLPLNFTGYHAYYERCCRNNSIVNLIPQESMAFHAYISPPLLQNTSPQFTDDPVPFLCVGDTTSILNSAFDPDGDLLTFSFVTPYNGLSSAANPAPTAPQPSLPWTIPTVTYAAGYSVTQPFGAGGGQNINASTGLTEYFPPNTGDYVVSVEIKEFRNGNLIGITRRDLQLLVLSCPPNPAPNIDPANGTTQTAFTIEEGETLCFDFGYNDPNGDSVTIEANGAIFDPAIINPAATITSPVSDLDTVSTEFCWTTACGQAQSAPYQFQVSAFDNGCPRKTTNDVFQITVNPVAPPDAITGPQVACQFGTETYSTTNIANTTYDWSVTGGTIVANNGSSVDVNWTAVGAASISVTATNQFGCISAPIDMDVTITPAPSVEAGLDTTICVGDTASLVGTTTAVPGFTATWTPGTGNIIDPNNLSTGVHPDDTTMYLLTIDIGGGCFAIDSVQVNVNVPIVDAGVDTTICQGDSVQLSGTVTAAGTIGWTPVADLDDATILNPFASPNNTTNYVLSLTDALGCVETDTVIVNVSLPFTMTTSPDTTICDGDCASLSASGATSYEWTPIADLNDPSISNPTACPAVSTTYQVIGFNGVCSDTATIDVTVGTSPIVDAGLDVQICEGDTIPLAATGAINYSWTPATGLSATNISNPDAFPSTTTEYFVTGTDAIGCPAIDSVTVTVNPLPTLDAGVDTVICLGDSVQLNGSVGGAGVFAWTPTTDLSDPNILNPFASPTITTEYVLTYTDGLGCTNTDTVMVDVSTPITVTTNADTTICEGDCANLSASGATTYEWTPTADLNNPNIANPTACPAVSTTYTVVGTTGVCTDTAMVIVTISAPPAVDAGLDTQLCIGDTLGLNATGAVSYTWTPALGLSATNIANPDAFPSVTSEYFVTGTDAIGCTATDSITITVNSLPSVDAGEDKFICSSLGSSSTLDGVGTGTPLWTPNTGLSADNVLTPTANPNVNTEYVLAITDANGCVNTDTVFVSVFGVVPTDAGNDTTICANDTIMIGGNPSGLGALTTYSWSPSLSVDDNTLANPMAFPTTTTMFYLTTSNDTCSGVDSVLVTVNQLPLVDAGADFSICIGDTSQLNATGAVSYTWNQQNTLSDSLVNNPDVYPTVDTEYIVEGIDANTCVNTDTIIVTINALPSVDAGLDTAICINDTAQLAATGAANYVWSPTATLTDPNISNPQAFPSTTTQYIVEGTDANLCVNTDTVVVSVNSLPIVEAGNDTTICINDAANLLASGADTYAWTPAVNVSDPNIANPTTNNIITTMFFVTGTDVNMCSNIDSVQVIIQTLPVIDAGTDVQICIGDTTQLNATGGTSYSWSPSNGLTDPSIANPFAGPTDTTQYFVTGTDALGCQNIDSVSVIVNPLPVVNAGNDQNICLGDTATLTATGADTYVWSPSAFLTADNLNSVGAFPDTTMEFIAVGTDTNGCVFSDSMIVNVFRISTIPDTSFCIGDSVQLDVFGSPGNSFVWTPTNGLSDPNISNPWASPTATTTYTVSATDVAGCVDQDSTTITIWSAPMASFDTTIVAGCEGAVVSFFNTSSDGVSYLWDFGDGTTDTTENVEHVYQYSGSFTTTLFVTNSFGCVDTASVTGTALGYEDYVNFTIPNVFTPNGDGENDQFAVNLPGRIYECVNMRIYNRWGQLMFVNTGNTTKWDGYTSVGQPAPEGSYFYTIDVNGEQYSGTLQLFR